MIAKKAKAPSLSQFSGDHLDADAYHAALQDINVAVVDVRNVYETALGFIQPPSTGATLIDPQLRNSIEFPNGNPSSIPKPNCSSCIVLVLTMREIIGVIKSDDRR